MGLIDKIKSLAGFTDADSPVDVMGTGRDITSADSGRVVGGSDAIYYDKNGISLSSDSIVSFIHDELERRKEERRPYEMQWVLNSNFLSGHQNCEICVSDCTVKPTDPVYESWSHEVFNCIRPLYDTRAANLMSVNYDMTVNPQTNEIDDVYKAQISTRLLKYTQSEVDFDHRKDTMIHYIERLGNCYVLSWWDTRRGDVVAKAVSEDENGDRIETDIHEGELAIDVISPYELFADDLTKSNMEDQRSIITDVVMRDEDIFDIYGIHVDGHDCDTYITAPQNGASTFGANITTFAQITSTVKDSEHVITYYERASRRYPHGRLAIVVGDNLISYTELPYDEIPITAIKCKEEAGSFYGKSIIDELIPLQRAYNGVKNRIHDYFMHAVFPVMLVPQGSLPNVDDYIDRGVEPGEIIPYTPVNGGSPRWLEYPTIPDGLQAEAAQLKQDMEYSAGVSQLMVYGQVANSTSGKAIESRRQIDSTRMSLTAENIRNAVRKMAIMWLHIYKRCASGNRTARIAGSNDIGNTIIWSREDITSFDVEFDTENELKNSEENQKQAFLEALQLGLFTDESGRLPQEVKRHAIELLKVGNYSDTYNVEDLQKQTARRENSYFDSGVIPDVGKYDDHELHVEEHMKYMLQQKFSIMKKKRPEYAAAFENHINAHLQAIADKVEKAQEQQQIAAAQKASAANNTAQN